MRREVTRPARARTDRCADMVFCGTASAFAISPAASPSGSFVTSRRNTSSRVDCASAAKARMMSSVSIYLDLWIYGPRVHSYPYFDHSRNTVDAGRDSCDAADMKL